MCLCGALKRRSGARFWVAKVAGCRPDTGRGREIAYGAGGAQGSAPRGRGGHVKALGRRPEPRRSHVCAAGTRGLSRPAPSTDPPPVSRASPSPVPPPVSRASPAHYNQTKPQAQCHPRRSNPRWTAAPAAALLSALPRHPGRVFVCPPISPAHRHQIPAEATSKQRRVGAREFADRGGSPVQRAGLGKQQPALVAQPAALAVQTASPDAQHADRTRRLPARAGHRREPCCPGSGSGPRAGCCRCGGGGARSARCSCGLSLAPARRSRAGCC